MKPATSTTESPPETRGHNAWTVFWKSGALHSCGMLYGANYEGRIASFWFQQFDELRDGASVVDIGTGNGAIPLLAVSHAKANNRRLLVTGVDAAEIDPLVSGPLTKDALSEVIFLPNTLAEALPFDKGSVDLVCSQYAVEYTDYERSVHEFSRILRHGGRFAAVVHAYDSEIVCTARLQASICDFLLDDSGFPQAWIALLESFPSTPAYASSVEVTDTAPLADAFNSASACVSMRIRETSGSAAVVLQACLGHAAKSIETARSKGSAAAIAYSRAFISEVEAERCRTREAVTRAFDREKARHMLDVLQQNGFTSRSIEDFRDERSALIGFAITATRS